ncbi:MAG: hypothetical protein WBX12_04795, partial [Candidatus Acidiferrales bacterium]
LRRARAMRAVLLRLVLSLSARRGEGSLGCGARTVRASRDVFFPRLPRWARFWRGTGAGVDALRAAIFFAAWRSAGDWDIDEASAGPERQ